METKHIILGADIGELSTSEIGTLENTHEGKKKLCTERAAVISEFTGKIITELLHCLSENNTPFTFDLDRRCLANSTTHFEVIITLEDDFYYDLILKNKIFKLLHAIAEVVSVDEYNNRPEVAIPKNNDPNPKRSVSILAA